MTTRAQLESEREALKRTLGRCKRRAWPLSCTDALTASIARVEALLSLTDAQIAFVTGTLDAGADALQREWAGAQALGTVAEIVRRTP